MNKGFLRYAAGVLLVMMALGACDRKYDPDESVAPSVPGIDVDTMAVTLGAGGVVPMNDTWQPSISLTTPDTLELHAGDRIIAVVEVGLGLPSYPCTQDPPAVTTRMRLDDGPWSESPGDAWPLGQYDGQFPYIEEFELGTVGQHVIGAEVRVAVPGAPECSGSCAINNRSLTLVIVHEHP